MLKKRMLSVVLVPSRVVLELELGWSDDEEQQPQQVVVVVWP